MLNGEMDTLQSLASGLSMILRWQEPPNQVFHFCATLSRNGIPHGNRRARCIVKYLFMIVHYLFCDELNKKYTV